jgi:biotin carboxyl carrier protein
MQYTYEYNGQSHTITLEKLPDGTLKANINGRDIVFSASPLANGAWLLKLGDTQTLAHTISEGDSRAVHLNGQHYALTIANAKSRTRKRSTGSGDLTAQMPGQVIAVNVAEGDSVTAGQTLVILEAMKMEIRVSAPSAGIVKKLYVQQGTIVERGQVLVEVVAAL